MSNQLQYESSPYLLQHADNPVNWYPWCDEAFQRARDEDKPVFLSIGYSTCHWCHVMAHESFEDDEIARILNEHFISIKVDKEERPDIDSIYMTVCQAFTGSGGWPTSIFMTAEQKPFFAGTYFPKSSKGGMIGLQELLILICEKWNSDRPALLTQAEQLLRHLNKTQSLEPATPSSLLRSATAAFKNSFDRKNAGFGRAPKFPTPHNLLFLLTYYERCGDKVCLEMAEQTLLQMYRGGLFDHIGFGFCRYSTDARFLIPHFEKMLYDNALLIMAYCKAYSITKKSLYLEIAEKTAAYLLRELRASDGGFYSAQDADSEGVEGKYYVMTPDEIILLLGLENGKRFCHHFDITASGNFEGKSIPNLLGSDPNDHSLDGFLETIYQYRKQRCSLHRDDKILTAWNALTIAAFCFLYQVSGNSEYLQAAQQADNFIHRNLYDEGTLFVSSRKGRRGVKGFLDDYATYLFTQLSLYNATLNQDYLSCAKELYRKIRSDCYDDTNGGFYLYGTENESLILRPKECYDAAIPSGNSLMAWNLLRLSELCPEEALQHDTEQQFRFLSAEAAQYPSGHAMFLLALMDSEFPPSRVTVVWDGHSDLTQLPLRLPPATLVSLHKPTKTQPLKDGKTTFYLCHDHRCLPPTNDLNTVMSLQ